MTNSKKKKKYKKGSGPPKPLSTHQSRQFSEKNTINNEKLTSDKIKEIKASLKSTSQLPQKLNVPPSAPSSPIDYVTNINSLKPPPPPPQISSNVNDKSLPKRTEIISELKEMFVKRGLVTQYDI
ncbi:MAG: hypothetical protein ACFFCL_12280 [Promethearchaeota archaeon]